MILLVSLEEAKTHLRIVNSDSDADVEMKLAAASEMVLRYMKLDSVPQEWLSGSPPEIAAPFKERGITLAVLGSLYEGRESDSINIEAIDRMFVLMLDRFPTMA